MRYCIIIVGLLLMLSSCSGNKRNDKSILAPDKMGSVLFDMNVADEFVTIYVAKDSSKDKAAALNKEYQKIYTLYDITEEQFKNSYEYYKSHPADYKILMDSLNAKAHRRREDLYRMPNS